MIYLTINIQKLYNQYDTTIEKYSHSLRFFFLNKKPHRFTVGMQNNIRPSKSLLKQSKTITKQKRKKYLYRPRARHTYNKIVSLSPETTFRIELQTRDTLIFNVFYFFFF